MFRQINVKLDRLVSWQILTRDWIKVSWDGFRINLIIGIIIGTITVIIIIIVGAVLTIINTNVTINLKNIGRFEVCTISIFTIYIICEAFIVAPCTLLQFPKTSNLLPTGTEYLLFPLTTSEYLTPWDPVAD